MKKILINYKNDYIYHMLLSNNNIIRSFKIVSDLKKNDSLFDSQLSINLIMRENSSFIMPFAAKN